MQYELGFIENLIYNELPRKTPPDPERVKEIIDSINPELQRIKTQWKNKVFASDDERKIERYIQGHQKALIELTNVTLQHLSKEGTVIMTNTEIDLYLHPYNVIYKALEELLSFIEKYFSRYFDQESFIPENYKWIAVKDFNDWLTKARLRLEEKLSDTRLIALCMQPVEKFISRAEGNQFTFRKLIFLKELTKEISKALVEVANVREANHNIRLLLFYLDLNSLRAHRYAIDYITAYVDKSESVNDRFDRLAFAQKCINQTQLKPDFSYYREYKTIKEQLSDWISEEILYAEKRKQLLINFPSAVPVDKILKDFKIKTSFSVPQLAYFVRILVDIGIIQNKNIQELSRFLSKFVGSKKAEIISEESFRAKFYAIDDATRENVRGMIIEMLNQSKKRPAKD